MLEGLNLSVGVAIVPVLVAALVWAVKKALKSTRFLPLISIVLGVVVSEAYAFYALYHANSNVYLNQQIVAAVEGLLAGIVVGAAAGGYHDFVKYTVKGVKTREVKPKVTKEQV